MHLRSIASFAATILACLFPVAAALGQSITLSLQDAYPTTTPVVGTQIRSLSVNPRTATAQPLEPAHLGEPAQHSLWGRFTAASNGLYTLQASTTEARRFRVAVYTNSTLETLGLIAGEVIDSSMPAVQWEARAGETYSIAFDSTNIYGISLTTRFDQFFIRSDKPSRRLAPGEAIRLEAVSISDAQPAGPVTFNVVDGFVRENGSLTSSNIATLNGPPWTAAYTNTTGGVIQLNARDEVLRTSAPLILSMQGIGDMVADAIPLPASFTEFRTYANVGLAGVEEGEPLPLRQSWTGKPGTLWYYFKPAFSGFTRIRSQPQGLWGVYDGNPLGRTHLAAGFNDVQFEAVAGRDYYLQLVVAGEPQTRMFSSIWITRGTLDVLPPADARPVTATSRTYASATPVARLVVTNLNAGDELVDIRLGDHVPDGLTAQGNPYFDIDVTAGFDARPVGTNQTGFRLTGPIIHVGHITNDTPATAAPLPSELQFIGTFYATADPSDPPELGGPGTPTAWWRYTAVEDGFAEFKPYTLGDRLFQAGVFRLEGGSPVPLTQTNVTPPAFAIRAGQTYLFGIGSTNGVGVPPLSLHGVRWVGLPPLLRPGMSVPVRLEGIGSFEGSVQEVRWGGSVVARNPTLPFDFNIYALGLGPVTLEVEYIQDTFGTRRTVAVTIPVFPAFDNFDSASDLWWDQIQHTAQFGFDSAIIAGREPGEPDPSGLGLPSVWHRFTPTVSGTYRLMSFNDIPMPREIVVATGTNIGNLHEIVRTLDDTSPVEFRAVAGVTYYISISADRSYWLRLAWMPGNDAFSMAVPLSEISPDYTWNPEQAGVEAGEPDHGGAPAAHSYWWSLDVPGSRQVEIPLVGRLPEQGISSLRIAIYEGDSLDSLVPVSFERWGSPPFERIGWRATAGRTYRLAVDSLVSFKLGSPVLNSLVWESSSTSPAVGQTVVFRFTDLDPTLGPPTFRFQPDGGTVNGSGLEWRWVPAWNGQQYVSAFYERGTNLGMFAQQFAVRPTNDAFSTALPLLLGLDGNLEMSGNFSEATGEPGEPGQIGGGARATVWYQWFAQATDAYEISGTSPDFLGCEIFEGTTLAGLVPVQAENSAGGTPRFNAVAGRRYRIALHLLSNEPSYLQRQYLVRIFRSAANDAFANGRLISATDRIIPFSLWGATADAGQAEQRGNVWFEYLPATNGTMTVEMTVPSGVGCRVYRGDTLETLEPVNEYPAHLPQAWAVVPVQAGEKIQIEMFSVNASAPEGYAFFFLPAGDPAGSGSDLIADRAPFPVGRAMQGVIFPWSALEAFEVASLPSERQSTLWWSHHAETRGRLTIRASATNHVPTALQPALAAALVQPDGSLSPLFNLEPGELLALDLEAGQRAAIRLTGQIGYRANVSSSWGAIPERPWAVIEPVWQAPGWHQLRFVPVSGQPYTVLTAPDLNGPWERYWRIDRANSLVMDIPIYRGTNPAIFFRITSP